jgi:hypothetical protein
MDKIRNIKRRIIAVFFAFIALFHFRNNGEGFSLEKVITALASPFAIFSSCKTELEEPPDNKPPIAHAQAEPTHTLANDLTITLDGTDSDGNITAYAWECESFTADKGEVKEEYTAEQVNTLITNADKITATVKPRKAGTYVFKLTVTGNNGKSDTDEVTVVVEAYTNNWTETVDVTVAEVTTSLPSMTLNIELLSNNYSFAEQNDYFLSDDFANITYTLTSITPNRTVEELSAHISDGVLSGAVYNDDSPIITQTFYYKGEVVGSRKFQARLCTGTFSRIYEVNDDNSIGTRINKIPEGALTLSKPMSETVTELP